MRSSLFWDVTQRGLVVSYRRFGITNLSLSSRVNPSTRLLGLLDHGVKQRVDIPRVTRGFHIEPHYFCNTSSVILSDSSLSNSV